MRLRFQPSAVPRAFAPSNGNEYWPLWFGLCAIIAVVTLASIDAAAVGADDRLLLPKFGLIAVPDTLATAVFVISAFYLPKFTKALASLHYLIRSGLICLALIAIGVFRGFSIGLPHVTGIGPEARGFFFTWLVVGLCGVVVLYQPASALRLIRLVAALCVVRDLIELFLYGTLTDVSQGTLSAIAATVLQSLAVLKRGKSWRLLLLAAPLDAFVLASPRRTPIIELAVGLFLTLLVALASRKSGIQTRVAAAVMVPALLGFAALIDSAMLDGRLTDRILSLDPRDSTQVETSNFEHRRDVEESLDLALESPIVGLGTGTKLPERYLTRYDEDVPIHSPHLNSWVRFGITGLLAYVFLQFAVLLWLFRSSAANNPKIPLVSEQKSILIGCSAYLWGQWALPPFYASDYKQCLCLGLLLGAALGLQRTLLVIRRRLRFASLAQTEMAEVCEA